jgi:hypothetical protein
VAGGLGIGLLLLVALAYGFTGYFRLSPEMAGLRESLQVASGETWHRKLTLNFGGFTCGAARLASTFTHLEPEARAALQSVRACEVGIYETLTTSATSDPGALLAAADAGMVARGWERLVGVAQNNQLVVVYVPRTVSSARRMRCAVLVCHERQLVLVAARMNLEPLLELALAEGKLRAGDRTLARK